MGCTELQCGLTLESNRIDHNDVLAAGRNGALDGVDAETTDAVDHSGVTGAKVTGIYCRSPTRRHAAADDHRCLQGKPVVDLDYRVLRNGGALGERSQHAHSAEIHSVAVETEGTVGHRAFEDGGTHVAEVLATGRAVATGAAVGDEATHDVVARLDLRDAGSDLFDDARAFVSADNRVTRREITVGQVQIRMAQSGSGVLDQYLTHPRAVEVEFHDLERLSGLEQYSSFGLHW